MKKISILLIILNMSFLYAEMKDDVTWEKSVNWANNNIEITVKTPLTSSGSTLAATRLKAENWIQENKTSIFFKNILDIQINSMDSISDIINRSPEIYYNLDNLGKTIEPIQKKLSTNLEYYESKYKFPIFPDFGSIFYNQSQHVKTLKKLDHLDYGRFTGLIIYVPEELPLYQKNRDGRMTKVLFPKIFDEDMNLILDLTMVEPEYMNKWGMVIYGDSFNENIYQNRIGITPLRIIARGLFGKNNSDIIISKEEADKLIGASENIKIISQARILILN